MVKVRCNTSVVLVLVIVIVVVFVAVLVSVVAGQPAEPLPPVLVRLIVVAVLP